MRISDWSSDVCSSDLHAVLLELLTALSAKPNPWFVLDTHAGAGSYDLTDSLEADDGIARLWRHPTPALARYLAAVRHHNGDSKLHRYPGSPLLIAGALRDADRLARSEERRVGKECVSTCRYRW